MKGVAITGARGYIGSRLVARLAAIPEIERIVGIDIRPPSAGIPSLKYYRQDISQPLHRIFFENEVESAVHLAFVLKPSRNRARTQKIDVGGSRNFLQACHQARVKQILYLSSHTVYGAHSDNRQPLNEDAPLRPLRNFQYSWDKVETEKLLREFAASHPETRIAILRACPVVGPGANSSVAAIMFKPPVMIAVRGYNPPMQFVHEQDIIELMVKFLLEERSGTYNVAGDGAVLYREVARIAAKRFVPVTEALLKPVMGISWKLHLQNDSPPSGLEFIKYPPLVSTERLKKETGFRFRYSSREAIASFVGR